MPQNTGSRVLRRIESGAPRWKRTTQETHERLKRQMIPIVVAALGECCLGLRSLPVKELSSSRGRRQPNCSEWHLAHVLHHPGWDVQATFDNLSERSRAMAFTSRPPLFFQEAAEGSARRDHVEQRFEPARYRRRNRRRSPYDLAILVRQKPPKVLVSRGTVQASMISAAQKSDATRRTERLWISRNNRSSKRRSERMTIGIVTELYAREALRSAPPLRPSCLGDGVASNGRNQPIVGVVNR